MQEKAYNAHHFKTYDKVRFCDTDRQGHVNNALFSTYLETGRVEILYSLQNPLLLKDHNFVIAAIELNLRAEIFWPGTVEIGTSIERLGNSSIGLYQCLYQNEKVVATARTTIVQVHTATKKSAPLSQACRDYLGRYL